MPPKAKHRVPTQDQLNRAGLTILKTVDGEVSVMQTKPTSSFASNVPDRSAHAIDSYVKSRQHELYGSVAMKARNFKARMPSDLDITVQNPQQAANDISSIISKRGNRTKITSNPEWGSYVVKVKKGKEYVDAIDIHPIEGHAPEKFDVFGRPEKPQNIGGLYTQTATDQLKRKANSVMAKGGVAPKRAVKDTLDFIQTSRVLLDSKQVQAEAELKRVQAGRKALKVWERKAKALKAEGYRKDPIPESREQEYIKYAVANPQANVDHIKLDRKGVRHVKETKVKSSSFGNMKMPKYEKMGSMVTFGTKSKKKVWK